MTGLRYVWLIAGFVLMAGAPTDDTVASPTEYQSLECMALNIYWETPTGDTEGQRAVGHVTVNRMANPSFPDTVCDVVRQGPEGSLYGCRFHWWCDGKSDEPTNGAGWGRPARDGRWRPRPDRRRALLPQHAGRTVPGVQARAHRSNRPAHLLPVTKRRLDQLLVERGLAENRSRAQALIMAGLVFSRGKRLEKPGHQFAEDTAIELRGKDHPWVGRGGLKLDHALTHFGLDVAGKPALDLGASAGGFTDVLLSHGTDHVYAVDVGHGQLAWKLRQDTRVTVLEKINVRDLDETMIPEAADVITADLSFISLKTALPAALTLAAPGAILIALIKPQFEAGRSKVGKGGIVTDPVVHDAVCRDIETWLLDQPGWQVLGITDSPVTGADGNKEFLIAVRKDGC